MPERTVSWYQSSGEILMTANPPPALPEHLHPLATELGVFYRELPQLLEKDEVGRTIVIKSETIYGTWDTFRDAMQYAYEKFPDGHFLAQKIDRRFLTMLSSFFPKAKDEELE